jgi:hypothetical protein
MMYLVWLLSLCLRIPFRMAALPHGLAERGRPAGLFLNAARGHEAE